MPAAVVEESKSLFIRRWGEMASSWGINRTMAEIHGLLYTSDEPLCTDDIMQRLQVSRGNASMNLRNLAAWGLISRVHKRGDRKEYFVSELNVWQMFETIMRERKRREIEPVIDVVERCRDMVLQQRSALKGQRATQAQAYLERLENMLQFTNTMTLLFELVLRLGSKRIGRLTNMLTKLAR